MQGIIQFIEDIFAGTGRKSLCLALRFVKEIINNIIKNDKSKAMRTYFWRLMDGLCREMEVIHYCLQGHSDGRVFHRLFGELQGEDKLQTIIHAFGLPPGYSSVPFLEPRQKLWITILGRAVCRSCLISEVSFARNHQVRNQCQWEFLQVKQTREDRQLLVCHWSDNLGILPCRWSSHMEFSH